MTPDPTHLDDQRLAATTWTDEEQAHLEVCTRCKLAVRRMNLFLRTLHTTLDVSALYTDSVPSEPEGGPAPLPSRYEDLEKLGEGGMGEVRRVLDTQLGRTAAMKILFGRSARDPVAVARFEDETRVAAQLQHPGLVPVYDSGRLEDGRVWFTMREVRGRRLTEVVRELHQGRAGWTLHRVVDAFATVCETIGYAHACGVLHRDLKPDNVMMGEHGEVLVLDWGLAKVLPRSGILPDDGDPTAELDVDQTASRTGMVSGTAPYMAPEQARGEGKLLTTRTDVYGLGAILYEILSGRPPYRGNSGREILQEVKAGPPPPPLGALAVPEPLLALCARAMARSMDDRFADGTEVAAEVRAWLEGARRREQALRVVAEADHADADAVRLRARAVEQRAEGVALLEGAKGWESEDRKAAGWERLDAAARTELDARMARQRGEQLLAGALQHDPGLPEAHAALVERARTAHLAAESARDEDGAALAEVRMRLHAERLPTDHPAATACAAYLKGDGALTLVTDPEGAEVELFRYEIRNRRTTEVGVRSLGRTPLTEVALPRGSYLCRVRHPERAEVRYPVFVERGQHWDGVAPGDRDPQPVRLPAVGERADDDCGVPAGWFWSGGDPDAYDSLPRRRLWCDELVVKRFPVTNGQYSAFLDDLVAQDREEEALRHAPRQWTPSGDGAPAFSRDPSGRFVLRTDVAEAERGPDLPALLVDWMGAGAYGRWLAARTGLPWRLLGEWEWEKAARGADGRLYPWGDTLDPSWCCTKGSHRGKRRPALVDTYPVDQSPYGVRGLGGNVQDWCQDDSRPEGPRTSGHRVESPEGDEPADGRVHARSVRGGSWAGGSRSSRAANRLRLLPGLRFEFLGFRVGYRPGSARRDPPDGPTGVPPR